MDWAIDWDIIGIYLGYSVFSRRRVFPCLGSCAGKEDDQLGAAFPWNVWIPHVWIRGTAFPWNVWIPSRMDQGNSISLECVDPPRMDQGSSSAHARPFLN